MVSLRSTTVDNLRCLHASSTQAVRFHAETPERRANVLGPGRRLAIRTRVPFAGRSAKLERMVGQVREGKWEVVDAELALLLFGAVAGDAVLLEQGAVLSRHGDTGRFRNGGDSHPKRSQSQRRSGG